MLIWTTPRIFRSTQLSLTLSLRASWAPEIIWRPISARSCVATYSGRLCV